MSADTQPVETPHHRNRKFRIVLRLACAVIILFLSIAFALSGDKDKILVSVLSALDLIDPFYIVRHAYLLNPFYRPPIVSPYYPFPDLAEPQTFYDLIVRSGWIAGPFLAVSTAIMYFVVADIRRKNDSVTVLLALLLSFVVAFPLKWILIGLVWLLGGAWGFVVWMNSLVAGMIQAALHAHDIYKSGAELKKVVHELHNASNPPSSI